MPTLSPQTPHPKNLQISFTTTYGYTVRRAAKIYEQASSTIGYRNNSWPWWTVCQSERDGKERKFCSLGESGKRPDRIHGLAYVDPDVQVPAGKKRGKAAQLEATVVERTLLRTH